METTAVGKEGYMKHLSGLVNNFLVKGYMNREYIYKKNAANHDEFESRILFHG